MYNTNFYSDILHEFYQSFHPVDQVFLTIPHSPEQPKQLAAEPAAWSHIIYVYIIHTTKIVFPTHSAHQATVVSHTRINEGEGNSHSYWFTFMVNWSKFQERSNRLKSKIVTVWTLMNSFWYSTPIQYSMRISSNSGVEQTKQDCCATWRSCMQYY